MASVVKSPHSLRKLIEWKQLLVKFSHSTNLLPQSLRTLPDLKKLTPNKGQLFALEPGNAINPSVTDKPPQLIHALLNFLVKIHSTNYFE
ncbi:MAG: hypothetical protein F6J96_19715 [Symploca sp. SIO1C2]|nr:hypothetical protein [Symploca sp. SIO1C2]